TTASSEHSWRSWNFAADRGGLRAQPLEKSPSASLEQDSMESWLTTRSTKRSHISTNSIYSRYPSHPHHSMTCSTEMSSTSSNTSREFSMSLPCLRGSVLLKISTRRSERRQQISRTSSTCLMQSTVN